MATAPAVDRERGIEPPCTGRQELKSARMSATHRGPPSPGKGGGAELRAVSAPLPSASKVGGNYDGCVGGELRLGDKGHDHPSVADRCRAWTGATELISREAASSSDRADRVCPCDSGNNDGALSSRNIEVQPKVFTRRPLSPNKSASVAHRDMLRGCCDRCKSDLNGKLLARCSVCGFCRRLYCFAPPLKQHPALEERADPKRRVSAMAAQSMIAQWKCEGCTTNLTGRAPSSPQKEQPRKAIPQQDAKILSKASKKRMRQAPPPMNGPNSSLRCLVNVPISKLSPPSGNSRSTVDNADLNRSPLRSESQAGEQQAAEFDWYKFRSEKAARVLTQRGTKDELVYYSRSVALMRKTARFWFNYVQQKKLRS